MKYTALTNVKTVKAVEVSVLGSGLAKKTIPEGEIGLLLNAEVRIFEGSLVPICQIFFPDRDDVANLRLDEIELVSYPTIAKGDDLSIIGQYIDQMARVLLAARDLEDLPKLMIVTPEIEKLLEMFGVHQKGIEE